MKVVALLGATLLATPALAQDETVEVEIQEIHADGKSPEVRFFGFHDMQGTRDEVADRAAARFAERDTDGNGVLEGEELATFEFRRHKGAMAMPRMRTMMHRETMDPGKMFEKIDTDGDGSISPEEFEAHHKDHGMHGQSAMRRLETLGRDGGEHRVIIKRLGEGEKLELPEGEEGERRVFVRRMGEGGSWTSDGDHKVALERIEKMLGNREDADGDGKVTRDEAVAAALARFDLMDKDGDGTLSDDERPHIIRRVVEIKD